MNKTSKIIIALLITILVVVSGFGGYYIYKLNEKLNEKNNTLNMIENEKNSDTMVLKNEVKHENNVVNPENITNNKNKESEISLEDKLKLAVSLSNFDSMNDVSPEDLVLLLLSLNSHGEVNVLKYNDENTSQSAKSIFEDIGGAEDGYQVFEYDESDVKMAAKEIFGVNLSTSVGINDSIRYNNGKYYYLHMPASGECLTIKDIKKNGNTYTFLALDALDSDEAADSEFTKYQVVIENGVIKSVEC